jgi:hypothetical protein
VITLLPSKTFKVVLAAWLNQQVSSVQKPLQEAFLPLEEEWAQHMATMPVSSNVVALRHQCGPASLVAIFLRGVQENNHGKR